MNHDRVVKLIQALLDALNAAIDNVDGDVFGIAHNDAIDAINDAEAFLKDFSS